MSTSETPVIPRDFTLSTTSSEDPKLHPAITEQELIRHLAVNKHWHWLSAGVLQRPWSDQPLCTIDVVVVRRLIHTYGWYWQQAGVLARPWTNKEVA